MKELLAVMVGYMSLLLFVKIKNFGLLLTDQFSHGLSFNPFDLVVC